MKAWIFKSPYEIFIITSEYKETAIAMIQEKSAFDIDKEYIESLIAYLGEFDSEAIVFHEIY